MGMNIFLIGFQGSGKTTVGQLVAKHLDWAFVDLDERVTTSHGKRIDKIRRKYGVIHYRQLERGLLEQICRFEKQVVASGASTVLSPPSYELMRRNGLVVLLEATAQTTLARLTLKYPKGVRIARGPDPVREIEARKDERQSRYALADAVVHTDQLEPPGVALAVIEVAKPLLQVRSG